MIEMTINLEMCPYCSGFIEFVKVETDVDGDLGDPAKAYCPECNEEIGNVSFNKRTW